MNKIKVSKKFCFNIAAVSLFVEDFLDTGVLVKELAKSFLMSLNGKTKYCDSLYPNHESPKVPAPSK